MDNLSRWFEGMWLGRYPVVEHAGLSTARATPLNTGVPRCQLTKPADDSGHVGTRRGMTLEQLAALASGQVLWIEAGNVTKNRGPSRPGNQIMMKALTRVFFGELGDEVPVNTTFRAPTSHKGPPAKYTLAHSDTGITAWTS